jgi:hypothetical protein
LAGAVLNQWQTNFDLGKVRRFLLV